MKNYIWLNPVVHSAYDAEVLTAFLTKCGFESVSPRDDHLSAVKEEYRCLLAKTDRLVIDRRCPLIAAHFATRKDIARHNIEPILIHVARELSAREDLADGYKWIVTPCVSLAQMGNSLGLTHTFFLSWDTFLKRYPLAQKGRRLAESPIPFGFFREISERVVYRSCDNLTQPVPEGTKLVEGLYCHGGCHRGDGVRCINED